jgi:phage tail sheath protein FI
MNETLVSPGVLAIENDQSFITENPIQAGAAIIGPTVRGPVGIPTICTTYSDYSNKFGTTFISGGNEISYFTSISAYNYFNNGGGSLLVTRVVSGSFTPATSSIIPTSVGLTSPSLTLSISPFEHSGSISVNGITLIVTGSNRPINTSTAIYFSSGSSITNTAITASTVFNASSSVAPYSSSLSLISASANSSNIIFTYVGPNSLIGNNLSGTSGSITYSFSGGTNTEAFSLETLSEGIIMNSSGSLNSDGVLNSGTNENLRWQILSPNTQSGTFSLLVRQGNDSTLSPSILETYNNLSLDPTSPNYIERIIGNTTQTIQQDGNDYYVRDEGDFPNNSKYVRVKQINTPTPNYLDNNGVAKNEYTSSIPFPSTGVFNGAQGEITSSSDNKYYNNISNTNTQGLVADNYTTTINLLSNKDNYKFNFISIPGLIDNTNFSSHVSPLTTLITNIQNRGDSMIILDTVGYGATTSNAIIAAASRNTSYAATYYPWIMTLDPNTGRNVWVPPSTMIAGVYAFNDAISDPWIAPAGINRGVIDTAVKAERFLSQTSRNSLYQGKVNPIATFQGSGVTVFGQKTLQTKKSALDRVNVRRLLIELKSFISQVAESLVFEPNNQVTRDSFLSQVNPYLSTVQQRQGINEFSVVMDESNNTPTTIDNNELIGAIYIQPARTAEFIRLDFNVLPTGATFPS